MDDWMNWGGWRWISPILGMAVGFYFGWDVRGMHERFKRFRADLAEWKAAQAKAAAEMEGPGDDA